MPLNPYEMELCKHVLGADEGMRLIPYLDCCGKEWRKCVCDLLKKGKLTIGVGRNLDDVGISENEALGLLENDIKRVNIESERSFPWFAKLSSARKLVIVSMAFNLGLNGLKAFQKMIKSIESGDFNSASNHMLNSKWAAQVGKRAVRLSETMRTGVIQG